MTCAQCGASVPSAATWCGQCFAAPELTPPDATRSVVTRPIPLADPERPDPVFSRWRGGVGTFGPVGRLCWTAGLLWLLAVFLTSFNVFGIVAWILAGPMFLRSVWARGRVS